MSEILSLFLKAMTFADILAAVDELPLQDQAELLHILEKRFQGQQCIDDSQTRPTLFQRRGGHPKHLLQDASASLSQREVRKAIVAEHIQKRYES